MSRKILNSSDATNFFELPENKFLLKLSKKTDGLVKDRLDFEQPCVIVSNHTSSLDKSFLSQIIKSPFVFLKQDILEKVLLKKLSIEEFRKIIECFNSLKNQNYSIVIFNDIGISPFGETTHIFPELSDFIMNFHLDIRFVNLYGSFFNFPIWADKKRNCSVKFIAKHVLKFNNLKSKSSADVNHEMNSCVAISASDQTYMLHIDIYSNNRAEFADRIIYACPNCKTLFSIYSEHSCLKCSNCGSAIEFAQNGKISLSRDINNINDLKEKLYDIFKAFDFNTKPIKTYDNCLIMKNNKEKYAECALTIYASKLIIHEVYTENAADQEKEITIPIKNIQKIAYIDQNTVKIWQKNKEPIVLKGENKENFYIIFDLIKVNHGETY